jgi:hypothetical protein
LTAFLFCSLIAEWPRSCRSASSFGIPPGPGAWRRSLPQGTAKAAFEAVVKRRPGEPILLCDRARIVLRAEANRETDPAMCGRVIQSSSPLRLAIVEGLDVSDSRLGKVPRRYNAAPSQELLLIRQNHKTGERSFDLITRGHWARPDDTARKALRLRQDFQGEAFGGGCRTPRTQALPRISA